MSLLFFPFVNRSIDDDDQFSTEVRSFENAFVKHFSGLLFSPRASAFANQWMELFSRRRWTKSNKYGIVWFFFGGGGRGVVINTTAYLSSQYSLHLLLLKSSMVNHLRLCICSFIRGIGVTASNALIIIDAVPFKGNSNYGFGLVWKQVLNLFRNRFKLVYTLKFE